MKKLLLIIMITLIPIVSQGACRSYMVNENGEGDIIESFKSRSLFFSCKRVYKKCKRALEHAPADAVCIKNREFRWKMVKELAHDIDKSSKLLHRNLESSGAGHDSLNSLSKLTEEVHELAESADILHEQVELYRKNSKDTKQEYLTVKRNIKDIRSTMKTVIVSDELIHQFNKIKALFKKLRRFY